MSADSTQATRDNPAMVQLARLSWTLSTGQVRSASAASAWLQVRRRPKRPKAKVRNTICRCHRQRRSTQAPRTATTPSWLQATTRPRAGHPCPAVPVPLPLTRFPGPLVPLDAVNHGGLPRGRMLELGLALLFCKKQNSKMPRGRVWFWRSGHEGCAARATSLRTRPARVILRHCAETALLPMSASGFLFLCAPAVL